MRSWRPFSLGLAGRMRSGRMPRRIHPRQLEAAATEAKGGLGAQRLRQAGNTHWLDGIGGGVAQGRHQDEAAVVVGEGQRVAALPVGQGYVALEVGAPALCRSVAVDQGPRIRGNAPTLASFPHQMVSLEDLPGRAQPARSGSRARSRSITFASKALVRQLRLDDPLNDLRCRRLATGRERSSSPSGPWIR